ncbi:MAG: hypothetical protein M3Q49_17595 [Actinomycetota bacterium]|nr:hypothetical protein [Actinomycetota bacterium]
MEQIVGPLVGRYRTAGVLVDTNLLLLYFVGAYDPALVARFKRTADRFAPEDFDTLVVFLERFERFVTTPHVLTEVSNLMGQLSGTARAECFALFARTISSMHEYRAPAITLSTNAAFGTFGITDTAIMDASPGTYLVLTDDLPLYAYLSNQGVDVLNFNNIRPL